MGVAVYAGPVHSDRALRLDTLMAERWGKAVMVVPTSAHARDRRDHLIASFNLPGGWGEPVVEITHFAELLLGAEGMQVRRVPAYERRLVLEHCLHTLAQEQPLAAAIEERPGLGNHLLRVILQLKQAAIEPEEFAERLGSKCSETDEIVAEAYARYQVTMKSAAAYDVPGLYWEAAEVARKACPRFLAGKTDIIFDGFDDFTPSELRLLTSLVPHVETLHLGLNLDERANRADLYALPRRTRDQVRALLPIDTVACRIEEPRGRAAFAAENIFWREEPQVPQDLAPDLSLVPCVDERHEVENALRRAKQLIVERGVVPADIALVSTRLAQTASLFQEMARDFGLPVHINHALPLTETRVGALVRRLVEAGAAWERGPVLELLLSPVYYHEEDPPAPFPDPPLDVLTRQAQIVKGQTEWRTQLGRLLERYAAQAEKNGDNASRYPDVEACLASALATLERLEKDLARLPESGTLAVYAAAMDQLLDEWCWQRFLDGLPDDETRTFEEKALKVLRTTLAALAIREEPVRVYRRADGLSALMRVLEEQTVYLSGASGGINVLDPAGMRNLRFAHVIFVGLNEGNIPSAPPGNAIYSDTEMDRLEESGIRLEDRNRHGDHQRLQFHHVLAGAQASLTLMWHLSEDGRESMPSPFVTEIATMFQGQGVEKPMPGADGFLPEVSMLASPRELLRAGMQQKDLRKHPEGEWTFVDRGLLIESDRFSNAPFGSHDAVLRDDKALAQLSETFGSDHLFSVNQIETYRNCPFHFFAHRVLRLEEEEAPVAEFDPRVRGTILHDALQAFHEHYRGVPVPEIPEIEGLQTLHGKLAKAFEQEAWKSVAAPDAVLRAERAYLTSLVSAYFNLERARKNADMWCPEHFEIIFGPGRRGEDSNDPDPFVLETDEGPVQFTGRIDRVDSADGGTGKVHRLVDYKTGSMPQVKDIESGYNIQLVLYALATEQALFPGDACEEALYLHIGKSKAVEALSKNPTRGEPKWEVRRNAAIEGVAAALRGIRSGWFPPQRHGQTCYGCGQARACRYNQRRITRKQSDNESNGPAS